MHKKSTFIFTITAFGLIFLSKSAYGMETLNPAIKFVVDSYKEKVACRFPSHAGKCTYAASCVNELAAHFKTHEALFPQIALMSHHSIPANLSDEQMLAMAYGFYARQIYENMRHAPNNSTRP